MRDRRGEWRQVTNRKNKSKVRLIIPATTGAGLSQSSPSSRHRAADRGAHPHVGGTARYAAVPRGLGMRLRPPSANECRRAGGRASSGRCENSGSRLPPASALSPRATPPPPHSLPLAAHPTAPKRSAPCSLPLPTSFLPCSHGTLLLILGESRREGTIYHAPTGKRTEEPGFPSGSPTWSGQAG